MPTNPRAWYRTVFPTAHRLLLERTIRSKLGALKGSALVIGAGYDPYRDWLNAADKVCLTDISDDYGTLDLIADAHALPFSDSSFESYVAIEVFEHLKNPPLATAEMHRVLKPGGAALISVPFMFRVHGDPYDFTRLTESGLRELFSGFTDIKITPFGARRHVISDIITSAWRAMASLRVVNHVLVWPVLRGRASKDCPSGYCVELVK